MNYSDRKFLEAIRDAKIAELLYDIEIEFPNLVQPKEERRERASDSDAQDGGV